jgi:hypothetical protein
VLEIFPAGNRDGSVAEVLLTGTSHVMHVMHRVRAAQGARRIDRVLTIPIPSRIWFAWLLRRRSLAEWRRNGRSRHAGTQLKRTHIFRLLPPGPSVTLLDTSRLRHTATYGLTKWVISEAETRKTGHDRSMISAGNLIHLRNHAD